MWVTTPVEAETVSRHRGTVRSALRAGMNTVMLGLGCESARCGGSTIVPLPTSVRSRTWDMSTGRRGDVVTTLSATIHTTPDRRMSQEDGTGLPSQRRSTVDDRVQGGPIAGEQTGFARDSQQQVSPGANGLR